MVIKGVVIENFKRIFHFVYVNSQLDEDNQLRKYATPSLRERINEKDSARPFANGMFDTSLINTDEKCLITVVEDFFKTRLLNLKRNIIHYLLS